MLRLARSLLAPFALASCLAVAAVSACGSHGSSNAFTPGSDASVDGGDDAAVEAGPLEGLQAIDVEPGSANLLAGDQTTSASFTATGTFADGTKRDITSEVGWSAQPPALLSASGTKVTPTGNGGGVGTMAAAGNGISGSAYVLVKYVETVYGPGANPGDATKFQGPADPSLAPALVYPLDGVLVPPNLDAMEFQWMPAPGSTEYDLEFSGPTIDLHVYATCQAIGATGGCGLAPDSATWSAIVQTLEGQDPAQVVVRALGASGKVGTSAPAHIQFATDAVQGGLYYFNTKSQTLADGGMEQPGIYRYDFAKNTVGPFFTQQQCAGCHALSNDGTKMLAPICTNARGCGRPLQLAVVDVATGNFVTPPMPVGDSDTQAWTPDDKYYVTTPSCGGYSPTPPNGCTGYSGGVMTLVDASNNTAVGNVPVLPGTLFPAFSNDGKHLAYARGNPYNGPLSLTGASLSTIEFFEPSFGAETQLVKSQGENNYYPSYSPDDQWVLFDRSTCAAGDPPSNCDTYDDPSAQMWVVAAGGGTPVALARANGTGQLRDSWPKWSPFKGTYKGGDIFWITFSSSREYGLRTRDATNQPTGVRQLWLVGFDLTRAKGGTDPSFAPLWLPFQEVTTSNHIGQWTQKVVGGGPQ